MPGRIDSDAGRKPSSRLSEDQQKIIDGKKKVQELVKSHVLKPLPSEPMQKGEKKSDVASGYFGQRNLSTVVGKMVGHSLSDLPEKIRNKLPNDDRFVVHKSKTREKVAYLEVKSADFKRSKWFEIASNEAGSPPKPKKVTEPKPAIEGAAPPIAGRLAEVYAGLGQALKKNDIPFPVKGKLDQFWNAIEEAALTPYDAKHPEKGSRVMFVAEQLAAFALGTKAGITAERINLIAMRMESSLRAEAHRHLHEGYQTWQALNADIAEAVKSSQTHSPGAVTKLSAPYFRAEMEALVGDHFDNDTKLTVYGRDKNEESLQKRLEMINGATDGIDLAVWKIYDDEPGQKLVEALIQKKRSDSEFTIRVMVDGNVLSRDEGSIALVNRLQAAGIQVMGWKDNFHPMSGMHWKALIVDPWGDHPQSMIGGRNVGIEYNRNGRWRDTDVLYEGRAALGAFQDFAWLWNESAGQEGSGRARVPEISNDQRRNAAIDESLKAENAVLSLVDRPGPDNKQDVTQMLLKAIVGAEQEITIEQGYFLDVPVIIEALARAARNGVRVKVFANSPESNDVKGLDLMNKAALAKLVKLPNVELFTKKSVKDPESGKPMNTLHSKFMTVDGKLGIVGSWNQHGRSMLLEAEGMVCFFDDEAVAKLNADFDEDVKNDAYRENEKSLEMSDEELKVVQLLEAIGIAHT